MSTTGDEIICRRCQETISRKSGGCPNCGASIRSTTSLVAAVILGVLLAVASVFSLSRLWFLGAIGVLLVAVGGYLLYDKRRRVREAGEATQSGVGAVSNSGE